MHVWEANGDQWIMVAARRGVLAADDLLLGPDSTPGSQGTGPLFPQGWREGRNLRCPGPCAQELWPQEWGPGTPGPGRAGGTPRIRLALEWLSCLPRTVWLLSCRNEFNMPSVTGNRVCAGLKGIPQIHVPPEAQSRPLLGRVFAGRIKARIKMRSYWIRVDRTSQYVSL